MFNLNASPWGDERWSPEVAGLGGEAGYGRSLLSVGGTPWPCAKSPDKIATDTENHVILTVVTI